MTMHLLAYTVHELVRNDDDENVGSFRNIDDVGNGKNVSRTVDALQISGSLAYRLREAM